MPQHSKERGGGAAQGHPNQSSGARSTTTEESCETAISTEKKITTTSTRPDQGRGQGQASDVKEFRDQQRLADVPEEKERNERKRTLG